MGNKVAACKGMQNFLKAVLSALDLHESLCKEHYLLIETPYPKDTVIWGFVNTPDFNLQSNCISHSVTCPKCFLALSIKFSAERGHLYLSEIPLNREQVIFLPLNSCNCLYTADTARYRHTVSFEQRNPHTRGTTLPR